MAVGKPKPGVSTGSFLDFLFIPIALAAYFKNSGVGTNHIPPYDREQLNSHQIVVLLMTCATMAMLGWVIF